MLSPFTCFSVQTSLDSETFRGKTGFFLCLHSTGLIFPCTPTTAVICIFTIVMQKDSNTAENKERGKKMQLKRMTVVMQDSYRQKVERWKNMLDFINSTVV